MASLGDASPACRGSPHSSVARWPPAATSRKAGTRAAVNTSPEPVSNWLLSLAEDGFVVGLGLLALTHPGAALIVVLVLVALIVVFGAALVRAIRRRFARPALATH